MDYSCPCPSCFAQDIDKYTRADGELLEEYQSGVLFVTYHTLSRNDRFLQIFDWLGGADFDGPMICDESHKVWLASFWPPPSHAAANSKCE